ncbi:efflux RND transporter periplasmic adaptor subunit [Cocleimonas flava]|uniref:RND family efflux transporter MFP subunit n=1 Tax=Cocleimonas flava TaxID=634765 RepID=A0A4R1F1B4_9GAMM|nr:MULTISPECIES: efflux RND transporter periplasmic adaptor subunit [Cocleimonas]MEB8432047.1 efflux RND transporter periplasmic adaptor subunit [Cocleimonas sp. KMM 6892]MEC4714867.1 efflux RND transporter periplasmic adaptor subunit [Cocleimonas sp. KMM 6895]MEC4744319.1 efflux RND transporter periplasmic adaptor subunit [Cocleimonas sp. KMM 6896]TCJ87090.1 RND family efflux transporter MFP subunit [Cocleimonas flava]
MSRRHKLILMGVSVVLALPLIGKAEISPLNTAVAVEEVVVDYQMLDGQIEAVNKSTVSSQTAGVISKLSYDVGDVVEKDALIARISSENQKSGLRQAQAAVSESKAAISSASAAVVQAEAAIREATANYNAARAEFNRVKGLYEKRIIARSQYDQAEANMKSTLARVESAKANLNAAKARTNAARSNLASAQAGLAKAGEQLSYTEVVAPYSGIVTERLVELGEVVSAGTPIMTGISLQEIRVVTHVPQRLILAVRKNKAARVYTDDDKTGIVVKKLTIFPYADETTNAFKVRASLDSAPQGLFPGVYVKIGFNVGSEKRLVVPESSVAYRSEVTGVYVVDEKGIPTLRQVRVGRRTPDGKVRILAGLDSGEIVAIDPVHAAVLLKTHQQKLHEAASDE